MGVVSLPISNSIRESESIKSCAVCRDRRGKSRCCNNSISDSVKFRSANASYSICVGGVPAVVRYTSKAE